MKAIFSNSSEVLLWIGQNLVGDHIGEGRVVSRMYSDESKVTWYNDSRDERMIDDYLKSFNEFERKSDLHPLDQTMPGPPWACDVFGAFCVLNRLAQGHQARNLRFFRASLNSVAQMVWSTKVQDGFASILSASWVCDIVPKAMERMDESC